MSTSATRRRTTVTPVKLTRAEVIEDLEWLADCGVGLTEAAGRVGKNRDAAYEFLRRAGRRGLSDRLAAHDPVPVQTDAVMVAPTWRIQNAGFVAECERARLAAEQQWGDDEIVRARRRAALLRAVTG